MARIPFNQDWHVQPKISIFTKLFQESDEVERVQLPHDAMVGFSRDPKMEGGAGAAYYPGGAVEYRKTFTAPQDLSNRRFTLEFQGIYRDAMIFVNGAFAAQRPNGYATFYVGLDPFLKPGHNEIRVEARAHLDSRWYSGLGIHRDVVLIESGLVHFSPTGPRITPRLTSDASAVIELVADIANDSTLTRTVRVVTELLDSAGKVVGRDDVPVTVRASDSVVSRQRIPVTDVRRWSLEDPYLYRARVRVLFEGTETDSFEGNFGIRTLEADPQHGLRINGESVKLRGACIHHDNGLLGATAPRAAEERRIRLLKEAGFNAIRAAHNPLSTAMLDACDRLGMLVMDEAFDMWLDSKNNFDYSLAFPRWWDSDIESMVLRGHNHPSVIMYSIGNEVLEAGSPHGALWARTLAEKVRQLDGTRLVTNGVSGFVGSMNELLPLFKEKAGELRARGNVNDLIVELHDLLDEFAKSNLVTDLTEEVHSVVDVVGHNYDDERYEVDTERFPHRVVVGTESVAPKIDIIWQRVMANPHVIGDFTWTGWDYLGEVGIGRIDHVPEGEEAPGPEYPWLYAWSGDLDVTGYRRPASFYREIVFGLRREPYLAVQRPAAPGTRPVGLNWSWTDTIHSWSFNIPEGTPLEVEVYSHEPEVELLLNGVSVGVGHAGVNHRFRATFSIPYAEGELVAVARRDGRETGRTTLRSARGAGRVSLQTDEPQLSCDEGALGFITIELRDEAGTLVTDADREIRVEVEGSGVLEALGSANPVQEPDFSASDTRSFEGRALAIVRPTGPGSIRVVVNAGDAAPETLEICVTD